jgi:hypothetical protein
MAAIDPHASETGMAASDLMRDEPSAVAIVLLRLRSLLAAVAGFLEELRHAFRFARRGLSYSSSRGSASASGSSLPVSRSWGSPSSAGQSHDSGLVASASANMAAPGIGSAPASPATFISASARVVPLPAPMPTQLLLDNGSVPSAPTATDRGTQAKQPEFQQHSVSRRHLRSSQQSYEPSKSRIVAASTHHLTITATPAESSAVSRQTSTDRILTARSPQGAGETDTDTHLATPLVQLDPELRRQYDLKTDAWRNAASVAASPYDMNGHPEGLTAQQKHMKELEEARSIATSQAQLVGFATQCQTVIACRMSPGQKAQLVSSHPTTER